MFGAVGGILGAGGGPVLMAAAGEFLFGGESAIGKGVAVTIAICCPLGAMCLALGFRAMREAMAEAERWDRS